MYQASQPKRSCSSCRRKRRRCDIPDPGTSTSCTACLKAKEPCIFPGVRPYDTFVVTACQDKQIRPPRCSVTPSAFLHTTVSELEFVWSLTQKQPFPYDPPSADSMDHDGDNDPWWLEAWQRHSCQSQLSFLRPASLFDLGPGSKTMSQVEGYLFQYYDQVISKVWAYDPKDNNAFRDAILPHAAAPSAGPLLLTVLALSAAEWARSSEDQHERYHNLSLSYKTKALNRMRDLIDSSYFAEYNLLTCVLLSALEIITGGGAWIQHLRGLLALQHRFGSHIDPSVLAFALQFSYTRYTLSMTARLPNEDEESFERALGVVILRGSPQGATNGLSLDPCVGCPTGLLHVIARISRLPTMKQRASQTYEDCRATLKEVDLLEAHINDSLPREIDSYSLGLRKSMEAFQCAAWVYLRLAGFESPANNELVSQTLDKLLACLLSIITGEQRRLFPMWPLFIAGCACSTEEHRAIVLELFDRLIPLWPVDNVNAPWRAIWKVWQARDHREPYSQHLRIDWPELLERMGWMLTLT